MYYRQMMLKHVNIDFALDEVEQTVLNYIPKLHVLMSDISQ